MPPNRTRNGCENQAASPQPATHNPRRRPGVGGVANRSVRLLGGEDVPALRDEGREARPGAGSSRPDQTDVLFDPLERVAVEVGDPLVDLVKADKRLLTPPALDAVLCAELSSLLEDRREQRDRRMGSLSVTSSSSTPPMSSAHRLWQSSWCQLRLDAATARWSAYTAIAINAIWRPPSSLFLS
jgi:hypothetical protein